MIEFTDEELNKLKECFNSLDDDGSGCIGIDELEEPLIGLGFAQTREEVTRMIDQVDEDGSGEIEFAEFLKIINMASHSALGTVCGPIQVPYHPLASPLQSGLTSCPGISSICIHAHPTALILGSAESIPPDPSRKTGRFGSNISLGFLPATHFSWVNVIGLLEVHDFGVIPLSQ